MVKHTITHNKRFGLLAIGAAMVLALQAAAAAVPAAQAAQPYYQGKTIRIIVDLSPGGRADTVARLAARFLPKYIPGEPTMIVQNMTGGRGMVAANYLYNLARADGRTIGTLTPTLPQYYLLKVEGVRFDPQKFVWLGTFDAEFVPVLITRTDRFNSLKSLKSAKTPPVLGAQAVGHVIYVWARLAERGLKTPFKIIPGYRGGTAIDMAVSGGEVDGRVTLYSTLVSRNSEWMEKNFISVLMQIRAERHPGLGQVPTIMELGDPSEHALLRLGLNLTAFPRGFLAPPGIPQESEKVLRQAFSEMIKDTGFIQSVRKVLQSDNLRLWNGETLQEKVRGAMRVPAKSLGEYEKFFK